MKKLISYLAVVSIICLTLTSSCKKEVDDRDAFVGQWNVNETYTLVGGGSGTDTYTITISKSSTTDNGIVITQFGGGNVAVNATVSGSALSIPNQTINSGGDLWNISGSGNISGNTLIFTYYVLDGWTGSCTATKL